METSNQESLKDHKFAFKKKKHYEDIFNLCLYTDLSQQVFDWILHLPSFLITESMMLIS